MSQGCSQQRVSGSPLKKNFRWVKRGPHNDELGKRKIRGRGEELRTCRKGDDAALSEGDETITRYHVKESTRRGRVDNDFTKEYSIQKRHSGSRDVIASKGGKWKGKGEGGADPWVRLPFVHEKDAAKYHLRC